MSFKILNLFNMILLKLVFKTETIITAVGDGKQRIMLWAGARKSIFEDFQNDF